MVDPSEKDFETTIEDRLLASGYVKRNPRKDKDYDRTRCLDPEALFAFIYATQPRSGRSSRYSTARRSRRSS